MVGGQLTIVNVGGGAADNGICWGVDAADNAICRGEGAADNGICRGGAADNAFSSCMNTRSMCVWGVLIESMNCTNINWLLYPCAPLPWQGFEFSSLRGHGDRVQTLKWYYNMML